MQPVDIAPLFNRTTYAGVDVNYTPPSREYAVNTRTLITRVYDIIRNCPDAK